jgi:hypothetical protein
MTKARGIGPSHGRVLDSMSRRGEFTVGEVAVDVGVDPSYVRRIVAAQQDQGKVEEAGKAPAAGGRSPRRFRVVAGALLGLLAFGFVAGCDMSPAQRVQWNERAEATAEQNIAAGLPLATVWCMEPADGHPESSQSTDTRPWVVASIDLVEHHGSCDEVTHDPNLAIRVDATFNYVGRAV